MCLLHIAKPWLLADYFETSYVPRYADCSCGIFEKYQKCFIVNLCLDKLKWNFRIDCTALSGFIVLDKFKSSKTMNIIMKITVTIVIYVRTVDSFT